MSKILKNKTETELVLDDQDPAIIIPASGQLDLSDSWEPWQIGSSDQLIECIGQGVTTYQLNDGTNDLSVSQAVDLVRGYVKSYSETSDHKLQVRIDAPRERDGRINVVNSPMPQGWMLYITGASDDMNPSPPDLGLGSGPYIIVEFDKSEINTTNGTVKKVEARFNTPVAIKDGRLINTPTENWKPSEDRWWLHFEIPANVHDNDGETNVYHDTANNIFIPANPPIADEKLKLINCSPVEVQAGTGFWDTDFDTGVITPACTWSGPNPVPNGNYHLLDITNHIQTFSNIFLGNPMGVFDVDVSKTEWLHQNWKTVLTVKKKSPLGGEVSFWFQLYRKNNIQVVI